MHQNIIEGKESILIIPLKSLCATDTLINMTLCNFICCKLPEKELKMLDQMVRNPLHRNRGKGIKGLDCVHTPMISFQRGSPPVESAHRRPKSLF